MTDIKAILELMADGEFHSGGDLGALLGVSRTAVWKHLQKLEPYGLPLESVKGRGYRLQGGLELLKEADIRASLTPEAQLALRDLDIRESIESTNALAMQKASEGCGSGYVCVAEHQSQGRGRRGRAWVSPFGQSIYLSVVMEFTGGAAALEGLSLAVGVALVRALNALGIEGPQLKWPNDILIADKKLAGILLEMTGDPAGVCQVVIGVGLNVSLSSIAAEAIDQPWVSLCSLAQRVSRNRLVAELLNQLLPLLSQFEGFGFAPYRLEWEQYSAFTGQRVRLISPAKEIEGVLCGVSESGALRLLVDGVEKEFHGGELSVRRVPK